MLTIRDGDGLELAIALGDTIADSGEVVIQRVIRGNGRLLRYYFGQGLRIVSLDSGDIQLPGTLSTRWLGTERQWIVRSSHGAVRPSVAGSPASNSQQVLERVTNTSTRPARARSHR